MCDFVRDFEVAKGCSTVDPWRLLDCGGRKRASARTRWLSNEPLLQLRSVELSAEADEEWQRDAGGDCKRRQVQAVIVDVERHHGGGVEVAD